MFGSDFPFVTPVGSVAAYSVDFARSDPLLVLRT